MRIAVTGSIASDHLMTFPGRFTEHLIAGHLDRVSLSFLADDLTIRRGGVGGFAITVISPNDPAAMLRHTSECREHGYDFLADPSQQLARADGATAQALVEGAAGLFTNEYERELLEQKTGWPARHILDRVGVWVTTLGHRGAAIDRRGEPTVRVPAVPSGQAADPTGVGDAFRAGFIAGMTWGLDDLRSAQLGCTLATLALEAIGPQEYAFDRAGFLRRLAAAYGEPAAADMAPYLPAGPGRNTDLGFR